MTKDKIFLKYYNNIKNFSLLDLQFFHFYGWHLQ
ncbi:hypothetical protein AEAC466_09960 [Asticcacaulis sp. AC466]|nr:hypothetical protein AEAC466_09960 [Asticcacaulis sp. AC466]